MNDHTAHANALGATAVKAKALSAHSADLHQRWKEAEIANASCGRAMRLHYRKMARRRGVYRTARAMAIQQVPIAYALQMLARRLP